MLKMDFSFDKVTVLYAVVNDSLFTPAPLQATEQAAAFDLHFVSEKSITLQPNEIRALRTNLRFEIPNGYEMQIRPRSGMSAKQKQVAIFGTIDSDYRGEVSCIMHNCSAVPYIYNSGMRIAQAVIAPVIPTRYICVSASELTETKRGEGGFGSTGH